MLKGNNNNNNTLLGAVHGEEKSGAALAVLGREISAFDVDVQRSLVTGVCQAPAPCVYRACLI